MSVAEVKQAKEAKRAALHECVQSGVNFASERAQLGGQPAEIQYQMRALVRAELTARKMFSDDEINTIVDSLCVGLLS